MKLCKICNNTGYKGLFHHTTLELITIPCECQKHPVFNLHSYILRMKNLQYAIDHGIEVPKDYLKGV